MAEENKNDKMVPKDLGSIIPGLLGFGAQIAGAIPGLRKPKKTDAASGAILAATTGAARAAAGAGAAGYGATRGLTALEAGRQSQQILLSAAPSIIQAANADDIRYQQDLQLRNARIANFGTMLGAGMSTLGAGVGTMVGDSKKAEQQNQSYGIPSGYVGAERAPTQYAPENQGTPGYPQQAPVDVAATPDQAQPEVAPEAAAVGVQPGQAEAAQAMSPQQVQQGLTEAALQNALGPRPQVQARGNQTIASEIYDIARRENLDPVMTAAHVGRYLSDPYANPAARLSPYKRGF